MDQALEYALVTLARKIGNSLCFLYLKFSWIGVRPSWSEKYVLINEIIYCSSIESFMIYSIHQIFFTTKWFDNQLSLYLFWKWSEKYDLMDEIIEQLIKNINWETGLSIKIKCRYLKQECTFVHQSSLCIDISWTHMSVRILVWASHRMNSQEINGILFNHSWSDLLWEKFALV